jgi:BASS family bile acid:Na+ symporter
MPGGTTSNLFTYFAKANLALSVIMTVNSTLFGIIFIPILLVVYSSGVQADLPFGDVMRTLFVLLVPVLLGMAVRRWDANKGAIIEMAGSILAVLFILLLLVTWVPGNWRLLAATPWSVYAGVIGLGLLGFLAGHTLSRALGLHPRNARTIALEIGIQNGPLAIAVVLFSFGAAREQAIVVMPALYSLFIVINATLLTLVYRRANEAAEQKMPDSLL